MILPRLKFLSPTVSCPTLSTVHIVFKVSLKKYSSQNAAGLSIKYSGNTNLLPSLFEQLESDFMALTAGDCEQQGAVTGAGYLRIYHF